MLNTSNPTQVPPRPAFRPGEVWLDTSGSPINAHGAGFLWHQGVCYWFGEHKVAGEAGNKAQVGVHVYSSRDLYHWDDRGIALAVSDESKGGLTRGCILERPRVLFNRSTSKFVMWFHLEPNGNSYADARSGVAVADAPTGPYRFVHSLRPNPGVWPDNASLDQRTLLDEQQRRQLGQLELGGAPRPYYPKNLLFRRDFSAGQMARDLTLFSDDDGTAYLIYASEDNGTLHCSELRDDYLNTGSRYTRIFPGRFHEAPAVMRAHGRYWLFTSDCTGWAPNTTRLSTATSLWGPWEELCTPFIGPGAQLANSFESQPTFILPLPDQPGRFIYVADRWRPRNPIDGRYVWLPVVFRHNVPTLEWRDAWELSELALKPLG